MHVGILSSRADGAALAYNSSWPGETDQGAAVAAAAEIVTGGHTSSVV